MAKKQKDIPICSKKELMILSIIYTGPTYWAHIYGPEIDELFKKKLIDWSFKDERGAYYSTLKLTDEGRRVYNDLYNRPI